MVHCGMDSADVFRRLRPHVGVTKVFFDDMDWCEFFCDWLHEGRWLAGDLTDPTVWYSADRSACRMPFILGVHATRGVHLEDDVDFCLLTNAEMSKNTKRSKLPQRRYGRKVHTVWV